MMGVPNTGVPSYTQPLSSMVRIGDPNEDKPRYTLALISSLPVRTDGTTALARVLATPELFDVKSGVFLERRFQFLDAADI